MIRQTSIEAYRQIESEGLLSARRFQVYRALFQYGPLTAGETWKFYLSTHTQIDSIRPRMAELSRLGVIRSVGERICRCTGKTCLVWDVTGALPRELPKDVKVSSRQRIDQLEERVKELEDENQYLLERLQQARKKLPAPISQSGMPPQSGESSRP